MAAITVRALSEETKTRLRVRAARNGRSTEAEVRAILETAVRDGGETGEIGLGTRFAALFAGMDTTDFALEPRTEAPRAAEFE